MSSLSEELSKPEYSGLTHQEIFNAVKTKATPTVGKIVYGDTLHLVSLLARGLRTRIDSCLIPELKTAWQEALHPSYLASPSYSINISLPEIRLMLDTGVSAGVCTQQEHDFIVSLATYNKLDFPSVKFEDIVEHFNPELLTDNNWIECTGDNKNSLRFKLTNTLPMNDTIRIEMSESLDGIEWTQFKRVAHFYNVMNPDFYFTQVPNNGISRKFRVKGEVYKITGELVAV